MNDPIKKLRPMGVFRRFRRNGDGVAAVEFALVVPLLLLMYLGTIEISNGVSVNKRTARVASTVADLVTQQPSVTKSTLESILEIGAAIMFPYNTTKPDITIVAIKVDEDPGHEWGKVVWSYKIDNTGGFVANPKTVGEEIVVPSRLEIDDSFLVRVTTGIEYRPIVSWAIPKNGGAYAKLDMEEEYYLRPRLADKVECSDC